MSYKVLGLIDCFSMPELSLLTEHRNIASTSFLGRYSFVDFPLSNFMNSSIPNIRILCQRHIRSLTKHIASGRNWVKNTKIGSCSILYDEPNSGKMGYSTDINCLLENRSIIKDIHPDYIVIAAPHMIYEYDYRELVQYHSKSNSRITMLYTKVKSGLASGYTDQLKLRLSKEGQVKGIDKNLKDADSGNVYLQSMILDYPLFESLLDYSSSTSSFFSLNDIVTYLVNTQSMPVDALEVKSLVMCIDSLSCYMKESLSLLDHDKFDALFKDNWPILTSSYDTPPTRYKKTAEVKNTFLSNGCNIEGRVENSILGRNVTVAKGAVVTNSILFSGTVVGPNTVIDYAITDKGVNVKHVKQLNGSLDSPLYVKKGDTI